MTERNPLPRDRERGRAGAFASTAMVDAAYAELIGLCRGILADDHVSDAEIVTLSQWLDRYGASLPEWPGLMLARRVRAIAEDGVIDEHERADLQQFIERAAGMEGTEGFDAPTTLPFSKPEPFVEYVGRKFCLTGTFAFGRRRVVEDAIRDQGGAVSDGVPGSDYLIIGATVTPAWKYRTHGLKIEEAVALRGAGRPIAIISEQHWSTSLC